MHINVSFLVKADQVSDYIPGISTITNLIDLFQKCVLFTSKQKVNISKSHYYTYLQQKSFARCGALLIPVLGNIIVAVYDLSKSKNNHKGVRIAAVQPIPPSPSKSSQSSCPPGSITEGLAIDTGRQLGEYAKSVVMGKNGARVSGTVQQAYSQSAVMAGAFEETARQLAADVCGKKSQVSGASEQWPLEANCCEHSLTESFMALYPALQTKPGLVNIQASAENSQFVGSHAQQTIQASAVIHNHVAPPSRLSGTELNKRLKKLLRLKCPHRIKDLIVQGHKFLKEAKKEIRLHGAFYLATAYELSLNLNIPKESFDGQALDQYLGSVEERLKNKESLLHYFAAHENKSIFIYLFAERPNIQLHLNALAGKTVKETPLQVASRAGAISIAQFLLEKGANFKKLDSCQNNALHHACQSPKDSGDIVKLLLQYDSTLIEAKNRDGQTPLHLAAFKGNSKSVEYLLNQIADQSELDLQDKEGNTSLHLAAIGEGSLSNQATENYVKIIAALVKKGTNLHISNKEKKTALELIFENKALIQALIRANLSSQMLVSFLQNYYLSQDTLSIFRIKEQQGCEFEMPLEKVYVRLGMIENRERKIRDQALNKHSEYLRDARILTYETSFRPKIEIEIEKIFEHETLKKVASKKIYIQGIAGIGKSTLCHYISYHWAKGKLWAGMFTCLFWISLRNFTLEKYPPNKEYTLADLIAREYAGKIDRRVIEACINDPAFLQNTLLVLDGYDELSAKAQANTSLARAFKQIEGLFPHILITSRPGSCSFERSCELELLGFDKEGIKRYIDRFFHHVQAEEKKQKLYHLLNSSPQVLSLAQIPINLTLLCCLFNEDLQVFDTKQPLTMSAIYARVVNRMYQWFLLRRMGVGPSEQTKEQILSEKNLRQNKEVAEIATAFEEMAAVAMENDTLYLSKQEIEDCRGKKILSKELADCGLMRIPDEERGYFIHLTFQEFLTASKVANQYLNRERQACQEFVRKYKFESRYALVLRMIAGYLSLTASRNLRYRDALQSFFDDLFSQPKDLAVSSELNLIAECFEECQDPLVVKQYMGFIGLVKDYIKSLCLLNLDFKRLLSNKSLLNHPEIARTIGELLFDPKTRKNMWETLVYIVETRLTLASETVWLIVEHLKDPTKDSDAKRHAIYFLEEVARRGSELPKEALAALIQAFEEGDSKIKGYAAGALKTIAKQGDELSKEALAVLIQALKEGDRKAKVHAADALREMAERGYKLSREVLAALIQALKESNSWAKGSAADALREIAEQGYELSREALAALIQDLKEGDRGTKGYVVFALRKIAEQGGELPEEALAALIQALKEDDRRTKDSAADVLKAMLERGAEFSEEMLAALIQALTEGDRETKGPAADVLRAMVERGVELPKEALTALIQALKEGDSWAKGSAADVLRAMVERGVELPKEALAALIQALKEGDSWAKGSFADVLRAMVERGVELPKEALAALIQALKEGDSWAKGSFADVLRAMVERGAELPKEALAALIQTLKEGNSWAKGSAVSALKAMAKQRSELSKEVLAALIQVLKEDDEKAKTSAALVLKEIAKQGSELSKEVLAALIQVLKEEDDEENKNSVVFGLKEIAKQERELSKEVLAALIQVLKEEDDEENKTFAIFGLKEIANVFWLIETAKQGSEFPEEMLAVLIQALKEGDRETKAYAASALKAMAKRGYELSREVLAALIQALKESDRKTKICAANTLEAIAKQGCKLPKEMLSVLIQALGKGNRKTKICAANALKAIAEQEDEFPKEILIALIHLLRKGSRKTKICAADALKAVAKQKDELPEEILTALIQLLREDDSTTKRSAASVLKTIAKQGYELSRKALVVFIQAFKEGDRVTKGYAASALGALAEQEYEFSKEALAALIQAFKEGDSTAKKSAASALKEIAKQGGEFPKEALEVLIQVFKEGDKKAKRSAASALKKIAKQGGELPKEAPVVLIQALKAGDSKVKRSATIVLEAIIKQRNGLLEEGLVALIQALKEDDRGIKVWVVSALGVIASQRGELWKEALAALLRAFKEGDAWTKDVVGATLEKIDKNTLLKMSKEAFALIAEVCFFTDSTFSVDPLELSYEQAIEKLPPELALWRKRLDRPTENFQKLSKLT
ncbi:ankyrin repeat domain-containing protein [Parachlamydia sp. AcF125]|uniref:ankyrin repeat domain-containing protein n=1 Tax=Parachlamydia sp. AcF125 TaxID=2795736 RepID=UPI001BC93B42|nr:ankyrin repeat domain-containing protein [Parachlamydia sp. AcF125]MBS4168460.1 Phosphocholine transferase AnkX [Parachlamydia sp. AcF125]